MQRSRSPAGLGLRCALRAAVPWTLLLALFVVAPPAAAGALEPPRNEVLSLARRAYDCANARGEIRRPLLVVIDYSLPSTERRLWLIEPASGRVLRHELVAHGRGSGLVSAERFSNRPSSHESSLGLYVTAEVYRGKHGTSLRLEGLEPGFNDAARERAIVIHGAEYVSHEHVARFGRLGRSLGCPALDRRVAGEMIENVRDGAAVFVYAPERDWLDASRYLSCSTRVARHEPGYPTAR